MKLQILQTDDWIGIYIDDKLVYEGHSIDTRTLVELLDINHDYRYVESEDWAWNNCPERFPEAERSL